MLNIDHAFGAKPRCAGARRVVALTLAAALLAACGQKGPLWVPGHSKDTPWPMKPADDTGALRKAPADTAPAAPTPAPSPAPAAAPDPARGAPQGGQ